MKSICNEVQEQISLGKVLSASQTTHLSQCSQCQCIYTDYQILITAFRHQAEIVIPENFTDNVMAKVYDYVDQKDWFENIVSHFTEWSRIKIFEYCYLTAGVGLGIFSFIRFIAFIFIPVG
ncbi:MAG: hypothetical protein ACXVCY_18015 [Pseudobdellovibrionaceae bacterium]